MFEHFAFVHLSGAVLWQEARQPGTHPLDRLITALFVEKRVLPSPFHTEKYSVYFAVVRELGLLVACTLDKNILLRDLQAIVDALAALFVREYEGLLRVIPVELDADAFQSFAPLFASNLRSLFTTGSLLDAAGSRDASILSDASTSGSSGAPGAPGAPAADTLPEPVDVEEEMRQLQLKMSKRSKATPQGARPRATAASAQPRAAARAKAGAASAASAASADDDFAKYSFVESQGASSLADHDTSALSTASQPGVHEAHEASGAREAPPRSLFSVFSASKALTEDDVAGLLDALRARLVKNNVAPEVSDQIVLSVSSSLTREGRRVSSLQRLRPLVTRAAEESIAKILRFEPRAFLSRVQEHARRMAAGQATRPFVVVVTGVNGVGKTTSIAKLLYLLKRSGLKTLVCACDSFRSGAVEQLQTHCDNLGATLFSQGYGKNAASIAKYGIRLGESEGYDVVLVDTTGRQVNNAPLMQALGSLVLENAPDSVVFVSECLTGTESINQVREFSAVLYGYSNGTHGIDGVILTKYDTCGDKIGACLNLCHASSLPIYFVGTGQTYVDFSEVSAEDVASTLIGQ